MTAQLALLPGSPATRRSLPLLTGSAMRTWRACPRLYDYRYIKLVRPRRESEALRFGLLMHAALEAWWTAAKLYPDAAAKWIAAATAILWHRTNDDLDHRARALALMGGYHCRWGDMTWDGELLEVLDVEAEFRAPLVNPETGWESKTWNRAGKIDCIVRGRSTGRVWILETKTTSDDFGPGTPYRDKLVLDPQISHYMVGAHALGYEPAGCIYDVLRRPGQRPKRGLRAETDDQFQLRIASEISESWDRYYARMQVVRVGGEEKRSAANDWELGLMIRHAERLGLFPQNPDACGRWGTRCPYLDVCTGVTDLDDPRYRRAERAHEELSAPAGAAGAPAEADAAE